MLSSFILFTSHFPSADSLPWLLIFLGKLRAWQRWVPTLSHDPTTAGPDSSFLCFEAGLNSASWCFCYFFRSGQLLGISGVGPTELGCYSGDGEQRHLFILSVSNHENRGFTPDLMKIVLGFKLRPRLWPWKCFMIQIRKFWF